MTVKFDSYMLWTKCENCKQDIYRREYNNGSHGDWLHAGNKPECKPVITYATPPPIMRGS